MYFKTTEALVDSMETAPRVQTLKETISLSHTLILKIILGKYIGVEGLMA